MTEIGFYEGVEFDEYKSWPELNNSMMKHLLRSPAHYQAALCKPRKETDEQRLGRAAHGMILEPDRFGSEFAIEERKLDGRTAAGKAARAEFRLKHGHKTILDHEQGLRLNGIVTAVTRNPRALEVLRDGTPEISIVFEAEGVRCKARLDAWQRDTKTIIDIKTTQDARPASFAKTIYDWGYYRQAAFYFDAMNILGIGANRFVFIAVESEAPHGVRVYEFDSKALGQGRAEYRALLRIYQECLTSQSWPGYEEVIEPIGIPTWAVNQLEERLDG